MNEGCGVSIVNAMAVIGKHTSVCCVQKGCHFLSLFPTLKPYYRYFMYTCIMRRLLYQSGRFLCMLQHKVARRYISYPSFSYWLAITNLHIWLSKIEAVIHCEKRKGNIITKQYMQIFGEALSLAQCTQKIVSPKHNFP